MLSITVTVTVQTAPPAKVTPESVKEVDPTVTPVRVPPQVFVDTADETTTPAGRVSVKLTPVSVVVGSEFVT